MRKVIIISTSVFIIAALTIFLIVHLGNNISKLLTKSISYFSPKAELFTELYFENNEQLPQKEMHITDFQKVAYTFSFVIHNEEGKNMSYPYLVEIASTDKKILDAKSIFIKNNESKTITETFYLPNFIQNRTEVIVDLPQEKQHIDFWIGGNQ